MLGLAMQGCRDAGMQGKKPKPKPGPKTRRLKLDGDWEEATKCMLEKQRPPNGWPNPEDDDSEDDPSKD